MSRCAWLYSPARICSWNIGQALAGSFSRSRRTSSASCSSTGAPAHATHESKNAPMISLSIAEIVGRERWSVNQRISDWESEIRLTLRARSGIICLVAQQRKLLGKILEEMQVATQAQIKSALKKQMQDSGKKLGELLIEMSVCTAAQITEPLARQFDYPYVDLKNLKLKAEVVKTVPRDVSEGKIIFAIKSNEKTLTIAM